ncbi:hypothetical protein ASPZODRAFT_146269 [Penicilliopsis zonata CBS 506.65]|uniref:Uncharacterized protein n=1 Tax=Penicilliopsis zonata CBS 506.65 TaxID=1073090 RepID=A0A1L9S7W3_9EURO|nr:hypothetical protein ASPZODRAFT_146269 [Penicilliopsis zonata CBS 506.65]OJJ43248.1 hypothetical protein ASPZODRAFT_146269 [Penicilliopsis zonata CBS 506.65]
MPMRWTADNDQLLLLKILETHNLSVDTKRVAAAWREYPVVTVITVIILVKATDISAGSEEEKPTPRAISERLFRMRKEIKSSGTTPDGGHFKVGKGSSGGGTPRKRNSPSNAAGTPGSGKRKRGVVPKTPVKMELDDTAVTPAIDHTPTKAQQNGNSTSIMDIQTIEMAEATVSIKEERVYDPYIASPSRPARTRTPRSLPPGMVGYDAMEDESEVDPESSSTEYLPEDSLERFIKVEDNYA